MLPRRARVNLGAMAMKGYSAFPKAPPLLEPTTRLFSVISRTLIWGVLPLCREAVSVFYSLSQLGKSILIDIMNKQQKDRRMKCVNITKSAFILTDYNPIVAFAIDNTKICNRILGSHQIFSKPISTNLCLLCYLLRTDEISRGQFYWQ